MFAAIDLPVYEARDFLAPAFYASLGFAVPAAIGAQLARPDERPLVLVGDGAFQMTGMELSTCARYGLDPIVIVLNNGGYTTERLIIDGAFNDIQRWDYSKLPEVIGAGRAHRVETVGDLDRALADARRRDGQFVLLDVRLEKLDVSPALRRLGASLQRGGARAGDGTTSSRSAELASHRPNSPDPLVSRISQRSAAWWLGAVAIRHVIMRNGAAEAAPSSVISARSDVAQRAPGRQPRPSIHSLAPYFFLQLLFLHRSLLLQSLLLLHWTHLLLSQTLPPLQSPLLLHSTHFLFLQTLLPLQSRSCLHFCLPSAASPPRPDRRPRARRRRGS